MISAKDDPRQRDVRRREGGTLNSRREQRRAPSPSGEPWSDLPEAQDDLNRLVVLSSRAVQVALSAARPPDEVYAICLWFTETDDSFVPAAVVLGRERDRRQALNLSPVEAFFATWDANGFTGGDVPVAISNDLAEFEQHAVRVREALIARDELEPGRWVLNRVARELSYEPKPFETTSDFVAYPLDGQLSDRLLESVRFAAPPAAVAELEAKGLLPRVVETLALITREAVDEEPTSYTETRGGILPPPQRAVAYIVEACDDELTHYLGRFDCHVTGTEFEAGPFGVPLEEALQWARARAEQVVLTVGEDEYSAGSDPADGRPPWPENQAVRARPIE